MPDTISGKLCSKCYLKLACVCVCVCLCVCVGGAGCNLNWNPPPEALDSKSFHVVHLYIQFFAYNLGKRSGHLHHIHCTNTLLTSGLILIQQYHFQFENKLGWSPVWILFQISVYYITLNVATQELMKTSEASCGKLTHDRCGTFH